MTRGLRAAAMLAALDAIGRGKVLMLVGTEDARVEAAALIERLGVSERVQVALSTGITGFRPREMIPDDIIDGTQMIDSLTMRLHAMPEPTLADNHRRKSKGERKRERRWRNDR